VHWMYSPIETHRDASACLTFYLFCLHNARAWQKPSSSAFILARGLQAPPIYEKQTQAWPNERIIENALLKKMLGPHYFP
jgi:hypothetical protein